MTAWYEYPVCVKRNGKLSVVPANEVQRGDFVWIGLCQYTVYGVLPDDDDEVMYIKINEIDAWPVGLFMSTI